MVTVYVTAYLHGLPTWTPVGMGKGGGAFAPWKCKVFCALAVTVKRSVDQLFIHYFHNFLAGQTGSSSSLVVLACVLRVTTKKVSFFGGKSIQRKSWLRL